MKKRLATIALVLCVMACCLWACASQPSGNGGAGGDAAQDQKTGEASDQASDQDQADAIKLLSGKEKVAAAQEFYAPKAVSYTHLTTCCPTSRTWSSTWWTPPTSSATFT